jgi:signal transduction histidine kinase
MIDLVPDRQKTLHLVQQISAAGRRGVTAPIFLQDVGAAVAEAFEFDSVAAVQYDTHAEEEREIGLAAAAPADRTEGERFASASLLAGARETHNLVLLAAGDVTTEFALPLMSEDRCLAVLYGIRRAASAPPETDWDALASVGVLAATLLEDVLARDEMNERDMLKSEFVALAAHELRNPVSSIYGISVTLAEREDELAESQRLALRNALQEQTSRMRNLVEQLLDLSRLDLGAIHISPVPLRLRPKIEELVRPLADARPDSVTIAVAPDLEAAVDPAALDRMLSNLIANSLRHGRPPVTITANRQDRHLRLAVEDRGEGVPREFVPRLFDRFARSPESRGRTDGSGLGLAIAQAYARAHGGEIVYEPAVPHGARFEVVLPRRGYREEQRRIESSSSRAPEPTRSS